MLSRWIDPTITSLQDALNFKGSISNYQFQGDGIGKIGTTGFVLGFVGGFHFALLLLSMVLMMWLEESITNKAVCNILGILMHWSMYITSLCIFHFMEFFATAVYQPTSLSYNSYIVNHSTSYTVAAIASWFEFWLETYLFGSYKRPAFFIVIGVILVLAGQIIRTLGMITCGESFNHQIMEKRTDTHKLVTTGIYSVLRHPAYFGFFWWSVGTQILLCNPLCTVAYAFASWSFFSARIPYEEQLLVGFYPAQYPEYAARTAIGIPFIAASLSTA